MLATALFVALPTTLRSQPLARADVPGPLVPWVDWALRDAPDAACPFVHGNKERRQCVWPARLRLDLTAKGGRFAQEWRVYREAWVPLPGDPDNWPEDVRIGDGPVVVVARGKVPMVNLSPGRHTLAGSFRWSRLPEFLVLPAETGLVALTLRGGVVADLERDVNGRLWLQRRAEDREGESRLDVIVHRRVIDEVPLELETRVELRVAGRSREVLLGPALPDHFVPMLLKSKLPARLEADGRLRVQVRPGSWSLRIRARRDAGPVDAVELPERAADREEPWDLEEVWVFDSRNDLRLVHVEGAPGIDPQQTTLPDRWKHLPAYLMKPGSTLRLVEKRRGDDDPAPDQLTLNRTWWLDFDGGGYTVHDQLAGTLHRSWRLEATPPTVLGRVAIDGQDQFLSQLGADDATGVEVRQGVVRINADSRVEGVRQNVPAVGWSHDFQEVSGQLNLPPGWRLFHASGVDQARSTWTTRWSLLEIFLVLVTAATVFQLWGIWWGALALVALTLIYPEAGAPRWSWLVLLAAQALLRVVPEGRLRRAVRLGQLGAVAGLVLIAIPFAVNQARLALHPALEFSHLAVQGEAAKLAGFAAAMAPEAVAPQAMALEEQEVLERDELRSPGRRSAELKSNLMNYYAPDPSALVSTGPGLPHWGWRTVQLTWSGPVEQGQQVRLLLIPPWANSLLAWLRIGLLALLVFCVLDQAGRLRPFLRRAGLAAVWGVALAGPITSTANAAELPSSELLTELRERMLEPPECFPSCAASSRLRLEVTPYTVRIAIEVDAAAETAVPLPGGVEHWLPETVLVDGAPATGLAVSPDGTLWVALAAGKHRLVLHGPLPDRETVQLPLPLKPHRVEASVSGWTLDGVNEEGKASDSFQLTRETKGDGAGERLEPRALPPFVRIERSIRLGLSWQVDTRVVRMTPRGRALFLEVPLLAGESVTSEIVSVEDGVAQISLAPDAKEIRWTSVLAHTPELVLQAPDTLAWTELWRLDAAPVWHVETTGIPPVHASTPQPIRVREWRPWPGERVELAIDRPESVDGRTLTLDRAGLAVRPGLRASEVTLALSLRSSRGVQHEVALPDGSTLISVSMDGALQPVRAVEGRVVLPIHPGKHRAELVWRSPEPIGLRYATPEIDPGAPSVNTEIEVSVPRDRWVLFVGGPRLGPAVLFWSVLVVALFVALALGRIALTPLGWGSWFLLFVGMTQVPVWMSGIVAVWLLALGWRRQNAANLSDSVFDSFQLLLGGLTLAALLALVWAVQQGLLGLPDMQIAGNGSFGGHLRWYHDRSAIALPSAWVVSVPLLFYRLAMLAWALWLARALLAWLRWGWDCFSADGLWRARGLRPRA